MTIVIQQQQHLQSYQCLDEKCIGIIEKNNIDKFKQLLSCGLHVNSSLKSRNIKWDSDCFSILSIAAFLGSEQIVQYLLSRGARVNQPDSCNRRTALHWAAASGHPDIARMLLRAGAHANALDRDSISPLILATSVPAVGTHNRFSHLALVRVLIENGADVNQSDRMNTSALHYACMRGHSHVARLLVSAGCSQNSSATRHSASFYSPLKYLCRAQAFETAKCLVEAGCDLSQDKHTWIFDDAIWLEMKVMSSSPSSSKFIQWLRDYARSPPELTSLCRRKVRTTLGGQHLEFKVKALQLSRDLSEHLLMD